MRVAIALSNDRLHLYSGPFGHADTFAIYVWAADGWKHVETRLNPYANLHGEDKYEKIGVFLVDCDMCIGSRFDHDPVPGENARRRVLPAGTPLPEVLRQL